MLTFEGKIDSIDTMLDKNLKQEQIRTKNGLIQIVKTLQLCAKQNIPLRGHRDNLSIKFDDGEIATINEKDSKLGNFNSLLLFRMDAGDTQLKEHLEKSNKNAKHTTDGPQNCLLELSGKLIQKQIIDEILESKYFSILGDETADISNKEQFALCIRYVHNSSIYTQFMEFVSVQSTTGLNLSQIIVEKLQSWNLSTDKLRGQGYDGASNMSGCFKGVQARIREIQPLAVYTHCVAHVLNLVVVDSCENPFIRDTIATVKEVINFFKESVQREHVLTSNVSENSSSHKLSKLCETRWTERSKSLDTFIDLLDPIFVSLEEIKTTNICNSKTSSQASSLLLAISQCDFILGLLLASDVLKQLSNLSKYLQKSNIDFNEAFGYIDTIINRMQQRRDSSDEYFSEIFIQATDICETFSIEMRKPRLVGRQKNRINVPGDSPEEYYRRAMMIPFLDHVISNLNDRFNDKSQIAFKLNYILAENIAEIDDQNLNNVIKEIQEFYKEDIHDAFQEELFMWRRKWQNINSNDRPKKAIDNLSKCNQDLFPSVYNLIYIICVLPSTIVECERDFSSLKLIKSYLRSTLTQTRLNSLALHYIHNERRVKPEEVVTEYLKGKHRF